MAIIQKRIKSLQLFDNQVKIAVSMMMKCRVRNKMGQFGSVISGKVEAE